MGFSSKISDKHKRMIERANEMSRKEGVKASFKVAKEMTTEQITKEVRYRNQVINDAIANLDRTAKDYPDKKHALLQFKETVTNGLGIKKQEVIDIQEELNKILGGVTSNTK